MCAPEILYLELQSGKNTCTTTYKDRETRTLFLLLFFAFLYTRDYIDRLIWLRHSSSFCRYSADSLQKKVIIIRKFRVMKRNLERVTHVEQKLIEISLILHQKVRTSMTSYSLLVSFFQICPQLGSMNFRWLVSCLLDFKQNGSFLIKSLYNWSNTVDFLISF